MACIRGTFILVVEHVLGQIGHVTRNAAAIILLGPPPITKWIKGRCFSATEDGCGGYKLDRLEHYIVTDNVGQTTDTCNLHVINKPNATGPHVGVEIIVFNFRERIPVRAVNQHDVVWFEILEDRQRLLRRSEDHVDALILGQ